MSKEVEYKIKLDVDRGRIDDRIDRVQDEARYRAKQAEDGQFAMLVGFLGMIAILSMVFFMMLNSK